MLCASQRCEENRPVCAAEVKRQIEAFAPQVANDVPMFPPGRAFRAEWKGPCAIDAAASGTLNQLQHFATERRRQDMQLGFRVVSFDLPKRWNQVNGVAEEAEIHHNYFAGALCLAVERGGQAVRS